MSRNLIQISFTRSEEERLLKRIKGEYKNRSEYHRKLFYDFISTDKILELDLLKAMKLSYGRDKEELLDRKFNVYFSNENELKKVIEISSLCGLKPATFLRVLTLSDLHEFYSSHDSLLFDNLIMEKVKQLSDKEKSVLLKKINHILKHVDS